MRAEQTAAAATVAPIKLRYPFDGNLKKNSIQKHKQIELDVEPALSFPLRD